MPIIKLAHNYSCGFNIVAATENRAKVSTKVKGLCTIHFNEKCIR